MSEITVTDPAHSTHLLEELVSMRAAGELFDYVIKGCETSFYIHSIVLAAMSPVFRALLRADIDEGTFPSIPDDIMAKVIDYAYTGTCTFSEYELMNLIKAAHYLQMPKLLKLCETKITAVLEPNNCFSWLRLSERFQITTAVPQIQHMMRMVYRKIISTEEFKGVEISELLQYLSDVRDHGTSSDDLLRGVLQWVKHDKVNRATHMQGLFMMVPIGEM